jgi:sulfur transfer protein SufE
LITHLSPTRGNGLRAMVSRIRDIAAQARGSYQ